MPRTGLNIIQAGPSAVVPNHLRVVFGRNVRQLRQARGWSQQSLADAAGTAPAHVSRIEVGRINLTLDLMGRIAAALDGDVQAMLLQSGSERDDK